jgi:hypothetical protein
VSCAARSLELGECASQILDERSEVAGAEELEEGAVAPELVVEGLVGEALPEGVSLLAVVADDGARVVNLVGEGNAQRGLAGNVGEVGEIARFARAPGARVVGVEAVRACSDDGGDLGAELGADAFEHGWPAAVLDGVVKERGDRLGLVAAVFQDKPATIIRCATLVDCLLSTRQRRERPPA